MMKCVLWWLHVAGAAVGGVVIAAFERIECIDGSVLCGGCGAELERSSECDACAEMDAREAAFWDDN